MRETRAPSPQMPHHKGAAELRSGGMRKPDFHCESLIPRSQGFHTLPRENPHTPPKFV
jgi:hypothetical protein